MATSPADSSRYFIRLRGQVKGPFTLDQLTRMAGRGQFSRLHQISVDQARWSPASELKSIFAEKGSGAEAAEPVAAPVAPAAAAPKEWYYNSGDSKIGPVDEAFIKNLIVTGKIHKKTLLWKTGLPDWLEARHFFPSAFGKPGWSGGQIALVATAATLLIALTSAGGYFAYTRWGNAAAPPAEPTAHAPKDPAAPAAAGTGLIHSTDLSDPAVNAAIDDATGMIVSYLDIDMATGEHHELCRGHGTCFVVTLDGYALTNKHVIDEHEKFHNATDDGRPDRLISTLKTSYGYKRNAAGEPVLDKEGKPEQNPLVTGLLDAFRTRVAQIQPKLVVYFGKRHFPATLVYSSSRFDMAVVKIDRPSQTSVYALSSKNEVPKLTEVVAFGFPGVSQKPITDEEIAVVEAKAKKESLSELFFGTKDHRDAYKASAFDLTPTPGQISIIPQESGGIYHAQHTAPIRQGNSGGPLVFRQGETAGVVYGINTLYLKSDSPVYIAFPVSQMREELETEAKVPGLTWK